MVIWSFYNVFRWVVIFVDVNRSVIRAVSSYFFSGLSSGVLVIFLVDFYVIFVLVIV